MNSARQLPAARRVHSAMQYVCQRCGTKNSHFVTELAPHQAARGSRAGARAGAQTAPSCWGRAPTRGSGGRGRREGILGLESLSFRSPKQTKKSLFSLISVIKWLPPPKRPVLGHERVHRACLRPPASRVSQARGGTARYPQLGAANKSSSRTVALQSISSTFQCLNWHHAAQGLTELGDDQLPFPSPFPPGFLLVTALKSLARANHSKHGAETGQSRTTTDSALYHWKCCLGSNVFSL